MYIIGGLEDQTALIVWSRISRQLFTISDPIVANIPVYQKMFDNMIHPLKTNQPVLSAFVSMFLTLLGENPYNYLLFLTLALNLFFSYLFFRRFKFGFVYALIFGFSAHTWVHLGVHIDLIQIWLMPLFWMLFLKIREKQSYINHIILGLFITFSTLVSNYYGFFILVAFSIYSVVDFVAVSLGKRKTAFKSVSLYAVAILTSLTFSFLFLFPYINDNFIAKQPAQYTVQRTYEDFFTFSSRPWYFILPPIKNPWLGGLSKTALNRLEKAAYFLTDDYFPAEHSGSYFGVLLLLSVILVCCYVFLKKDVRVKKTIVIHLLTIFAVVILMLPPFFTISGVVIWTPGYLLFKFFPMFRVTARLAILVLLLLLTTFGYCMDYIFSVYKAKLLWLFMISLLAVTLFETYIPLKIQNIGDPPDVYVYLRDNIPPDAKFAVYPRAMSDEALFWLPVHRRELVNAKNFVADDFETKLLNGDLVDIDYVLVAKDHANVFFQTTRFIPIKTFGDTTVFQQLIVT